MRWLTAAIITSSSLLAQLNVNVILRDPLPAAISSWQEDPTLVRLVITASGPTPAYPHAVIGFELRDASTGRLLARSKDGHPRQPRISIPPGPMSLTLSGRDIVAQEAVEIDPSIESRVLATGFLPEGTYEFCVRLLDERLQPIAATGQLCARARLVVPDPPVLLSPGDTSRLTTWTPLFRWTPINPVLGPVLYRLRIVPVYPSQDRRSAIDRNTPIYEQDLPATTLQYPASAPALSLYPDAVAFAWQVQALTPDGRPAARNEGKSAIFIFFPPSSSTARTGPAEGQHPGAPELTGGTTPPPSLGDTLTISLVRLPGGYRLRLTTPVQCRVGSSCTIGPGEGIIWVPWLGDTLRVHFGSITILLPAGDTVAQLSGGSIVVNSLRERLLRTGLAPVAHALRILQWEFTPAFSRVRAQVQVDWGSMNFSCRTTDSAEFWVPLTLSGLELLRLKLPSAWNCNGDGMLIGNCVSATFDSLIVHARFDTSSKQFTGSLTLGGSFTISCLSPPVTAYTYLRLDRGGADFLLTLISPIRASLLGTHVRVHADTLVLDLARELNPPGFPPAGLCSQPEWSSPEWRGLWIPGLRLFVPIGDGDTVDFRARNVIAEDVGGRLKLSLLAVGSTSDTIRFAGFRIRIDTVRARWCRGAFQEFALRGLLILPPGFQHPASWAQLDSLYLRFTADAAWNWTATLDIYGQIQLDFGSYARLILQNGRLARIAPGSGYVEFTLLRLQAPPTNPSASVEFGGLRIWNDGRVELESAEGWINLSRWGNLTIAGITLQVQEVGLGYHQPSTPCSSAQKHWWVGLTGGVSIDASSGLPGGGNGVRVRRLRIYDNLCMTSEGAGIDVSVSGVFSIRGDLQWGDITYGSGSGSVTAKGLRGSLSGSFTCLGGVEAQIDFALGSTGSPSYNFWFVQGAVVVPGGVPIVPGAFHLVGGILGAGWRVQLDEVNRDKISETSGIVPPPPIVPNPSAGLLLRGGLIFADASLQFYRLTATGTVVIGSSLQLGLDAGLVILPSIRLAEGNAWATVAISGGRLQPPISLGGSASVRLIGVNLFSASFSTSFQPGAPCIQIGPFPSRRWILADLDANIGSDILGAEVIAKAYAELGGLQIRLCPTEGEFWGSFRGAGVVGVTLSVAGVGTVPFHFGLGFSTGFCGYYLFQFYRSGSNYVGWAKLAGGLDLSLTFDQSGWYSWGWHGTSAVDHLEGAYCSPPGNWVDLDKHWRHCRKNDRCDKSVEDCRQLSIAVRARGIFEGQLTIPQTCFTVAGRQVCLPKLHGMSISAQYGYYGYGRYNNREGAKKGGPLADAAEALSCGSLQSERQNWANQNASQQQPPSFIVTSSPGRGQSGFRVSSPLLLEFGAPIDGTWSSGGSGLRQWQIRNLQIELWDRGVTPPRRVAIGEARSGSRAAIYPVREVGSWRIRTSLLPNTPYRLIASGEFWARNPNGSEVPSGMVSRDTIDFTTGPIEGFQFRVVMPPSYATFRDVVTTFTPPGIELQVTHDTLLLPLQFGRDLWLRIRDGSGRTYEWRGPATSLIRSVSHLTAPSGYYGTALFWDTLQLQPRVIMGRVGGVFFLPNQLTFTVINAKKAGSAVARPDTADRLLEGMPLEIDSWSWTRAPSAAEQSLQLSTKVEQLQLNAEVGGEIWYQIQLRNTGTQTLFAGTPFRIRLRKNINGSVTESWQHWVLPEPLAPGQATTLTLRQPSEPGFRGASVLMLPNSPFSELTPTDNCAQAGNAGCAGCSPPPTCAIPAAGPGE